MGSIIIASLSLPNLSWFLSRLGQLQDGAEEGPRPAQPRWHRAAREEQEQHQHLLRHPRELQLPDTSTSPHPQLQLHALGTLFLDEQKYWRLLLSHLREIAKPNAGLSGELQQSGNSKNTHFSTQILKRTSFHFISLHRRVSPHALPPLLPVTGPMSQVFTWKIKSLQWGLQSQPQAQPTFLVKMTQKIPGSYKNNAAVPAGEDLGI